MRLAFKIMAAVMLVMAVLLVIHAILVTQREVDLFRADMEFRAQLLGSVLAGALTDIWRVNGVERVNEIVADANRSEDVIQVRWVWLDAPPGDSTAPRVTSDQLSGLNNGNELLFPNYSYEGADLFISYYPVPVPSNRPAALELTQPLALMYAYVRNTVARKIALYVAFVLVSGALVWWLGVHIVGRPVHSMAEQAAKVGRGDLMARNELEHQNDELGHLAHGLNRMVDDLRQSRDRLDEETARRIEAMQQLNHAERLATVGKLASGLAHELGTPLNVVAGRAKMIATNELTAGEVTSSAATIQNQAERMTGIIRQLLDFARSKRPEKKQEQIIQPVQNVVTMLAPLAAEAKVSIDIEEDGSTPLVDIDINQIQQVLSNLIINAIHAMPDGGHITIRCGRKLATVPAQGDGRQAEYAFLAVVDEGIGIPEDNLSRIFTPFFSTKDVGQGTGLGLSIAHGIVRDHGGWMVAESEIGKGSTFTIYLPPGEPS